jgi:hypothetical protein
MRQEILNRLWNINWNFKRHRKMEIITLSEICESIYRSFSKFEDIKEVMRNHISINRRQWNGQKEKGKR